MEAWRSRDIPEFERLRRQFLTAQAKQRQGTQSSETETSPRGLKLYPALAQRALLRDRDRELRVWTVARYIDRPGEGRVRVSSLRALIKQQGMRGLSESTLRRLLQSGEGLFWTMAYTADGEKLLYLAGLRAVCTALGVRRLRRSPALVPVRWAKSLRAFRAACYGCTFPREKWSSPISRGVIEKLTGLTPRTQRNYDRALADLLAKKPNARFVKEPGHGDELDDGLFVDKVEGDRLVLLQRLPNSYTVAFKRAPRGMLRRVNQQIRRPFRYEGKGKRDRLFYRNERAAQRRLQQQRDDWFCLAGADVGGKSVLETRGHTALWTAVQKCAGVVL